MASFSKQEVGQWLQSFPGRSAPRGDDDNASPLDSLDTPDGILRLLKVCAPWKLAVETISSTIMTRYEIQWKSPTQKTGRKITFGDLLPLRTVRDIIRSILATGFVIFRSSAKGIEIAEPFIYTLQVNKSLKFNIASSAASDPFSREKKRWSVIMWSRPNISDTDPRMSGLGAMQTPQASTQFQCERAMATGNVKNVAYAQYRSPCKDALPDTWRLLMLQHNHTRRDWHNSRPAVFTHFNLQAGQGSSRPWFDGVTPTTLYPELDTENDFQLLVDNRSDAIRAMDDEMEMIRKQGTFAKQNRITAQNDSDPIKGMKLDSKGHYEHRITDGYEPKSSCAPLTSQNDNTFMYNVTRGNVLQQLGVPYQAVGDVPTGERQASTAIAFRNALERYEENVNGLVITINEILAACTKSANALVDELAHNGAAPSAGSAKKVPVAPRKKPPNTVPDAKPPSTATSQTHSKRKVSADASPTSPPKRKKIAVPTNEKNSKNSTPPKPSQRKPKAVTSKMPSEPIAILVKRCNMRHLALIAPVLSTDACARIISDQLGVDISDIDYDRLAEAQQKSIEGGDTLQFESYTRMDRMV